MAIIVPAVNSTRPQYVQKVYKADVWKGQLRVAAWPKKRTRPLHPNTVASNNWLKAMVLAYKMSAGETAEAAMIGGHLQRMRPQDWWLHVTSGAAWILDDPAGGFIYPRRYLFLLCNGLDTIGAANAGMLVRTATHWRPLAGGGIGAVLVMQKDLPAWSDGTETDVTTPSTPAADGLSTSLDVVTKVPGSLIYRDQQWWTGIPPGNEGDILKIGADGRPAWTPA